MPGDHYMCFYIHLWWLPQTMWQYSIYWARHACPSARDNFVFSRGISILPTSYFTPY